MSLGVCISLQARAGVGLTLSEDGEGLDHIVTVESRDLFKLGFENGLNYGLTQWFDLVADPQAERDLSQNHTGYLPEHAQGALFNQCLNPHDLIGHVVSARRQFKKTPRSIKVLERGPVRVVVENSYHPMLAKQDTDLLFNTRYVIYPTGKIFIVNTLTALEMQEITMWRNSVLGLGDPSFDIRSDAGVATLSGERELSVPGKHWKPDVWRGRQVTLPGWTAFEIVGNSATTLTIGRQLSGSKPLSGGNYVIGSQATVFGWLRGDSVTFPKTWHKEPAEFLFCNWDKATPPPLTDWTQASIMLVPFPGNPRQGGGGGLHGWKGYKRLYYEFGTFSLQKNESVTQYYMMQLGTEHSGILPHIGSRDAARVYADDYRIPLNVANATFDKRNGYYALAGTEAVFDIGERTTVFPVFALAGSAVPEVLLNGQHLRPGIDYIGQINDDGTVVVQLLKRLVGKNRVVFGS